MGEKQPTIEQRSSFAAKTKEGQDVEFVATIKFYVNPTGDVRIVAPGADSAGGTPHHGRHPRDTGPDPTRAQNDRIGAELPPEDDGGSPPTQGSKGEGSDGSANLKKETTPDTETKPSKEDKKGSSGESGKFPHHKDVDKKIPRGGDCAINQFIPDPCRAVSDLTQAIKGFFSWSSGTSKHNCPPCPGESPNKPVSNTAPTPRPQQLVANGELGNSSDKVGEGVIDKEIKYEV